MNKMKNEEEMSEEPERRRVPEIKVVKFHGKSDLNIQQWIKLVELKCRQLRIENEELMDQLIDLLEGDALIFYLDCLTDEKTWNKIKEKLVLQYSPKKRTF